MRFSSSEKFCAGILAAVFAFSACAPKVAPERRLPAPKIMGGIPQAALPSPDRTGPWLQDLYEPSSGTTACEWLEKISRPTLPEARFQLIDNVTVTIQDADTATKKKTKKGSAENHYLLNVSGMIDSGGSPLYSYALLSQTIPSKKEFLGLVDQEIGKAAGFPFTLYLGRFLMKLGILNVYTQRNKIIEERINDALPGIFATSEKESFTIKTDSIPWVILKSGARELDDSAFTQIQALSNESERARAQAEADQARYQKVLDFYGKSAPVFSESTWRSLSDEMRVGLSTAIRSFKTRDPVEKTCATTILHRILSQLFMIIGYDRLPFEQRKGSGAFHLPTVDSLLESKQGTRYMVCPTAGSFIRNGHRVIIDRDVLTSFNSKESPLFDLTAGPQPLQICERSDAVPYTLDLHQNFHGETAGELASGSSWLALINALANFIAAFTPSSPWWQESTIGFPMAAFESLERIKSSGAVLPSDANALSLGLLNVSIATFLKKHLVFLDERNRVVTDAAQASKIRISEAALNTGNPIDRLVTRLESAVLLGETAFKLGEALKTLAALKSGAEADLKSELDRIREISPDTPQAEQLKKRLMAQYQLNYREFLNFVESMYATRENLNDLTATGPESMREQIESLKLASALLLAEFAYPDGSGHYGCFNVLETDLSSGEERKLDTCSEPDKRLWKYALGLVAKEFRSPQFALLAE